LFSSSTSYLPQTTDEKRQSVSSRDSDSRGLLSKFRKKKEKSGSRESNTRAKDREIVSPISPTTSTTDRHSPLVSNDQSVTARLISDLTTRTTPRTAGDIPFSVHRKFQPIPQNKNSDKYILVTVDNVNFRPINIGQITKKNDFKNKLIETLIPQASNISIHLTDFDCLVGEALDDQTLDDIVNHRFDVSSGKFLVVSTDTLSTLNSSYMTSTSDIQSFDSKETKNPNTPQHYYDTAISKNPGVDYLNFKEYQLDTHATVPRSRKSSREEPVLDQQEKPPPPSQQPSSSGSSTTSQTGTSKSSLSRKKPMHINSSFRVIRPTEKGEINFDKRRESPYSRPSLVAKRSAPPPPKRPSEKLLNIRTDTKPSSKSAWLESVQESVSGEGSYISPYTPSSSNTLIPEPYKGGNSVSPISRKALDATLDDRFEDSQSVQEAHSNVILDTSKGEEEGVSRGFSNRGLSKTFSSRSTAHKFKENFISFDDAPQLEDESEEEEDGSDEDFWAKVPSEAKSGSSTMSEMIVRPAPEVLYDNLEKFFPDADLDRPVIDVSTPPASPLNDLDSQKRQMNQKENEPPKLKRVVSSSHRDADTSLRPQRMKTIRAVAREAGEARKRESIRRNTISQNKPSLVRRQSTKMWGRKVVEVKPNQRQFISKLRKDKDDNISEFSWIKGELIGKGTFGNVYIALNVTTGEMIAVKQVQLPSIPQKNSRVSDVIEALRSEVDTLKDLDHLNIVQYLGFEETERVYNLFLEYVAGGSVASCLRLHGRFDEPLIKFLTSQILGGLAYLHSRGILHRDMKADNLLLDLDGVCKISDFGISKKSNDIYANDAGMSMQGTIFWMAPEVVDSRGEGYSAKVDIWSLGCVVLEMFAGRRPWSNLEAIPAMLKIGKAKAAPPIPEDTLPHVSMEGRSFLDSCFTTNPQERPTAQRLSKDAFCRVDPRFSFANTRLAGLIKTNEKKVIV
jgi:mitogen-activated protein kinase kinase kinase